MIKFSHILYVYHSHHRFFGTPSGLGKMDFVIQKASADSHQLPTSHTCFNTLLLPDYGSDYEKLEKLLGRAILECEGFGLE